MLELSDHVHPCVYLPEQNARMPLLYPTRRLTPEEFDLQLASGRRRSGSFVYYTACPNCNACEPSRCEVQTFQLSKSMRRVWNQGKRVLTVKLGPPGDDQDRLNVFNQHRHQRNLAASEDPYSFEDFHSFLVESCCDTYELSFWEQDRLVACTVIDCGLESVSAVYTYFDPAYSKLSPGTFSILTQIDWAKREGKRYLYLGMFVADNQHLRYKARFSPQERFQNGRWVPFESPISDWSSRHAETQE